MQIVGAYGAMYVIVEENDVIEEVPVKIGNGILSPGEFVRKLGEKKRSSFEMEDGYYLRYVGQIREAGTYLLFGVNYFTNDKNLYYAFGYVDPNTLFVGSEEAGGWDVRVKRLEKFTPSEIEQKMKKPKQTFEQLELFEELT